MEPYYQDESVRLYHGDMREILPALRTSVDLIVADPPYGETTLGWDRWPEGWVGVAANVTSSMWCFGSMRMWLTRGGGFTRYWNLSQDVIGVDEHGELIYGDVTPVWEKPNGSGFASDRFRRVHEYAAHWYRGAWNWVYRQVPRVPAERETGGKWRTRRQPAQTGAIDAGNYVSDGTRMVRSVIRAAPPRHRIHPTEKPVGSLLVPLIEYACPPGGWVLDPFAGSGSTAEAARQLGRHTILIEADERYCQAIARRMSQTVLPGQWS